MVMDVARYWENPMDFVPERFLGHWNKDAFIPFSSGARWVGNVISDVR
jgi:cytochrome P450